jgi:hypothetical protein
MLTLRSFHPPWPVGEWLACFIVRDRTGQARWPVSMMSGSTAGDGARR